MIQAEALGKHELSDQVPIKDIILHHHHQTHHREEEEAEPRDKTQAIPIRRKPLFSHQHHQVMDPHLLEQTELK